MKYETPEVTVLTSAINAIQSTKSFSGNLDSPATNPPRESGAAYEDWE